MCVRELKKLIILNLLVLLINILPKRGSAEIQWLISNSRLPSPSVGIWFVIRLIRLHTSLILWIISLHSVLTILWYLVRGSLLPRVYIIYRLLFVGLEDQVWSSLRFSHITCWSLLHNIVKLNLEHVFGLRLLLGWFKGGLFFNWTQIWWLLYFRAFCYEIMLRFSPFNFLFWFYWLRASNPIILNLLFFHSRSCLAKLRLWILGKCFGRLCGRLSHGREFSKI